MNRNIYLGKGLGVFLMSIISFFLFSFGVSAGIVYESNHIYAYGRGLIKYDISDGVVDIASTMLHGCIVKDVIVSDNKILALTQGVYEIENDYVSDNKSRLFYSDNHGESFKDVTPNDFLINEDFKLNISAIAASLKDSNHIIANISSLSNGNWYYESFDFGISWNYMFRGEASTAEGICFLDNSNGFWAYGSGVSMTGEVVNYNPLKKWALFYTELPSIEGVLVNRDNYSSILYYSSESINITIDNGASWIEVFSPFVTPEIMTKSKVVNKVRFSCENNKYIYALISEKRSALFPLAPLYWTIMISEDNGKSWRGYMQGEYSVVNNVDNLDFLLINDYMYVASGEEILFAVKHCAGAGVDKVDYDLKGNKERRYRIDGTRYKDGDCGLYIEEGRMRM